VIRLSCGSGVIGSREALDEYVIDLLQSEAKRLDVTLTNKSIPGQFSELIQQAHQHYGQRVVILIDEYDKPILDNILEADRARELREGLKNLYSAIKDADPHLHFVAIPMRISTPFLHLNCPGWSVRLSKNGTTAIVGAINR